MSNNKTKHGESQEPTKATGRLRPNPLDVAWLAGIFDGEGCIIANWVKSKKYNRVTSIAIRCTIGNTNLALLLKAQRIIYSISGVKEKILVHHRATDNICFRVSVLRQRSIKLVLEALLPHLTGKRAQVEAALVFLESRKQNRHRIKGYSEEELGVIDLLRSLKKSEMVPNVEGREAERFALESIN